MCLASGPVLMSRAVDVALIRSITCVVSGNYCTVIFIKQCVGTCSMQPWDVCQNLKTLSGQCYCVLSLCEQ